MPRKNLLELLKNSSIVSFPRSREEFVCHYTLSDQDLAIINQHRGDQNRLGFAVQLCCLRYPGLALPIDLNLPASFILFVSQQLGINPHVWQQYARRSETRREHLAELQLWLNLKPLSNNEYYDCLKELSSLAEQTDKVIPLASAVIEMLRQKRIIIPPLRTIERICSEAITQGKRRVYAKLTKSLSLEQKTSLDNLLSASEGANISRIFWLRQPAAAPRPKHILSHLKRLKTIEGLNLPSLAQLSVHQNRLSRLAKEGAQMTSQHIRDLEPMRRYATLIALIIDTRATLIDEIIGLNERILNGIFSKAKRHHAEQFQSSGKAINEKVNLLSRIGRALIRAKDLGEDPFTAIESVVPWNVFSESIEEAEALAQPVGFDSLPLISKSFNQLRRYTPEMLISIDMKAAPSAGDLIKGVEVLREMNASGLRKVPDNAPTSFVRNRWRKLVFADDGLDRKFYEFCVISELKNSFKSGDIWVHGSRQYKDFEEYLLPKSNFIERFEGSTLDLSVGNDCESYLAKRLDLLDQELLKVEQLAARDELPDALIMNGELRIMPLENSVPDEANDLIQQAYSLLPRIKITDLLLEVDSWTGFTQQFEHLKTGKIIQDKCALLTAILADAINLGLRKMSQACPEITYAELTWTQAWHVRDETYTKALSKIVNSQHQHAFSAHWGDGTTSSSDGQNFNTGGHGQDYGQVNLRYGRDPGVQFYTHISDQYAPFYTNVINANIRDATHVLDGLLYHESDLEIEEHFTDTAGFTDHVFALMHLLGFRFAPRIRDLKDKKIYINGNLQQFATIKSLIGGSINLKHIRAHWNEVLRLALSIKQGTVTASLMIRKLASYPRQNGLAIALRELGRIERTLFMLDWIQNKELRRRVHVGLNKGEARNALARAVFFNRLGQLRDRSFENQFYRASGLNLVIAAITLWNTVYLEKSIDSLKQSGKCFPNKLLKHLSPLGWEHINLTGDYIWPIKQIEKGKLRPLIVK